MLHHWDTDGICSASIILKYLTKNNNCNIENKTLTIVECKRYTGDLKAVSQLRRYVEKIKSSKGIDLCDYNQRFKY